MFWHLVLSLYSRTPFDFPNNCLLLFLYMLSYLKLSKSTQNIFLHKPSVFSLFSFILLSYYSWGINSFLLILLICSPHVSVLTQYCISCSHFDTAFFFYVTSILSLLLFLTLSLKSVYHQKRKKYEFFSNKISTILLFIILKIPKKNKKEERRNLLKQNR